MPSILSLYSAVSKKWFFGNFRIGHLDAMGSECRESLASPEFAKMSKMSNTSKKLNKSLLRHRYVFPNDEGNSALMPTCPEEAEALKAAPPWAGRWASKPTLRQRLKPWIDYIRRR
jgi:hypothetical protein